MTKQGLKKGWQRGHHSTELSLQMLCTTKEPFSHGADSDQTVQNVQFTLLNKKENSSQK